MNASNRTAALQLATAEPIETQAPPACSAATRRSAQPLPSPALLRQRLPLSPALAMRVDEQRTAIRAVLDGQDPRLLVVVGPCSLHDPDACLLYTSPSPRD